MMAGKRLEKVEMAVHIWHLREYVAFSSGPVLVAFAGEKAAGTAAAVLLLATQYPQLTLFSEELADA